MGSAFVAFLRKHLRTFPGACSDRNQYSAQRVPPVRYLSASSLRSAGYYPLVEVGLLVNDEMVFVDPMDKPLLYASEDKAIQAIFSRQTDMSQIDKCFRGQKSFEDDMRDGSAGSE